MDGTSFGIIPFNSRSTPERGISFSPLYSLTTVLWILKELFHTKELTFLHWQNGDKKSTQFYYSISSRDPENCNRTKSLKKYNGTVFDAYHAMSVLAVINTLKRKCTYLTNGKHDMISAYIIILPTFMLYLLPVYTYNSYFGQYCTGLLIDRKSCSW